MKNRISMIVVLLLAAATSAAPQDMPLSTILVKNDGWKEAANGLSPVQWLSSDPNGKITVHLAPQVGENKSAPKFLDANVALAKGGVQLGVPPSEDVTTPSGVRFHVVSDNELLCNSPKDDYRIRLPAKLTKASGLVLWPDGGTLVVGDAKSNHLWAFKVEKDGKLSAGERYYPLRTKPDEIESHVTALAMDNENRLYACTQLGVQVFDPTGRLCGVVSKPGDGDLTGVALGGKDGDTLYVACGDKVYSRKVQVKPKPK